MCPGKKQNAGSRHNIGSSCSAHSFRPVRRTIPASGVPLIGTPGEDGVGLLQQTYLEGSNVQIVEELINLIKAERAFESNSKIVSASSDILQQTNQLI